jgi:hypothetical protein
MKKQSIHDFLARIRFSSHAWSCSVLWIMIWCTNLVWPGAGKPKLHIPAPAKSFGSLRLWLHNTVYYLPLISILPSRKCFFSNWRYLWVCVVNRKLRLRIVFFFGLEEPIVTVIAFRLCFNDCRTPTCSSVGNVSPVPQSGSPPVPDKFTLRSSQTLNLAKKGTGTCLIKHISS